jgi:hypothetical protein
VRVMQLMTWQQRLSALVALRRMGPALLSAARLFHAASSAPAPPLSPSAAAGGGGGGTTSAAAQFTNGWPADTPEPTQAAEVGRQMLTILCAHMDTTLSTMTHNTADAGEEAEAAARLADVAAAACLVLGARDALASEVFPRFQRSGLLPPLLTALESYILAGDLASPAPEIVQALVEHFASLGLPARVERCVLKMDLLSLDLNQLIPLCVRHGLYSALLHVFAGAMGDFHSPAALLLVASAAAAEAKKSVAAVEEQEEEEEERKIVADKEKDAWRPQLLSPILSSHFSDADSPVSTPSSLAALSGSASFSDSAARAVLNVDEGLRLGYKLLVFLRCCLLGQKYPPGAGDVAPEEQHRVRARAAAFLLRSSALSVWEAWQTWGVLGRGAGSGGGSGSGCGTALVELTMLPKSIKDPHPALRYLVRMDPGATLSMLRSALANWDALEADLREFTPSVVGEAASLGERSVTQAFVDAVVALLEEGAFADRGPSTREGGGEAAALRFLAEHLAANRAAVGVPAALRILEHLTAAAQSGGVGAMPPAEREAIFADVAARVGAEAAPAERRRAAWLARAAGFLQAEAAVRMAEGSRDEALACLARDARFPAAAFKYARETLVDPGLSQQERAKFADAVLARTADLVLLDAEAAAALVSECLPASRGAALSSLAPRPELQFAFLRAVVRQQQQQAVEVGEGGNGGGQGLGVSTFKRLSLLKKELYRFSCSSSCPSYLAVHIIVSFQPPFISLSIHPAGRGSRPTPRPTARQPCRLRPLRPPALPV